MFDYNQFKRSVKEWIKDHPNGELDDLIDFCEEMIPPAKFTANKWILDQTISWYKHILSQRKFDSGEIEAATEEVC